MHVLAMRPDDPPASRPYPVINAGVRVSLYGPDLEDYVASYGGPALVDELRAAEGQRLRRQSEAGRRSALHPDVAGAGAHRPGPDHAVLLPEQLLLTQAQLEPRQRHALQQAINHHVADRWRKHRARVTPVAGIPLAAPAEAIAQLAFATRRLGFRAIAVAGEIPAAGAARAADYDGVWDKVVEAGVPLFVDAGAGDEAAASDTAAFLAWLAEGGVLRRFPALRIAVIGRGADPGGRVCRRLATQLASGDGDPAGGDWRLRCFFGTETLETGAAVNAIYASDLPGVPELPGAPEGDLRDFLFANAHRLCAEANVGFWKDTSIPETLPALPASDDSAAA
jgi:hypothetical protein